MLIVVTTYRWLYDVFRKNIIWYDKTRKKNRKRKNPENLWSRAVRVGIHLPTIMNKYLDNFFYVSEYSVRSEIQIARKIELPLKFEISYELSS